jgi:hypothetical protein
MHEVFARVPSKEVSEKHKGVRMAAYNHGGNRSRTSEEPVQYVPTIGPSYTGRETAMLDHVMLETHSLAYIAVHQFRQSGSWKYFHPTDRQLRRSSTSVINPPPEVRSDASSASLAV